MHQWLMENIIVQLQFINDIYNVLILQSNSYILTSLFIIATEIL